VVVLNAASLKSLPAVRLPRRHRLVAPHPQHLAVVAEEFLVEACLEVVEVCLVEAAANLEAIVVDAAVDAAAVVAVDYLAVEAEVLDSKPLPLALQTPSTTTNSFLSRPRRLVPKVNSMIGTKS
jgi:hypothetical protein